MHFIPLLTLIKCRLILQKPVESYLQIIFKFEIRFSHMRSLLRIYAPQKQALYS